MVAGNTTGQTGSSGLLCQARTSSSTASVIRDTVSADSSVPYTRCRWCRMSRTLMPCVILSSRVSRGCDLRHRVVDSVVDAMAAA